ncbi:MAG: SoxR reducing system RseC family protein [Myxococcota bacterium]|jgi:sigma-E factor negative regulatory protein RseC|nr:SoxR reducing system RseC family protein [Myxococcota bacterium]
MSENCQETGIVTAHGKPGYVRVKIERAEACHSCAARGACGALGGQKADLLLEVQNTVQAQIGDSVRISLAESSVVTAAAVLYVLPVLGLVAFAFAARSQAAAFGLTSDATTALGAGIGLAVGLLSTWLVSGKLSRSPRFIPKLVEVVSQGGRS